MIVTNLDRLHEKSDEVFNIKRFKDVIKLMNQELMKNPRAYGISAPQVGVKKRIISIKIDNEPVVMINPSFEIIVDEVEKMPEGCLSLPGQYFEKERAKGIKVFYTSRDNFKKESEYEGFYARVIQHEVDHLDGILFIDKAKNITKLNQEINSL